MEFIKTDFKDAWIIKPQVFQDHRGFFFESYSKKNFEEKGIDINFVQDNHSMSLSRGVLRGLHFQKPPYAQTKLVRVTRGAAYDVIVDIRKDSDTFGKWQGFELTAENFLMLLVPKGFAHGFLTLSDSTEFLYKCDDFYHPEADSGLLWNDPSLNINWPINDPILSEKDKLHSKLKDLLSPF